MCIVLCQSWKYHIIKLIYNITNELINPPIRYLLQKIFPQGSNLLFIFSSFFRRDIIQGVISPGKITPNEPLVNFPTLLSHWRDDILRNKLRVRGL